MISGFNQAVNSMIRQIRVKLSLYYGIFFSFVLCLAGILVYNRIESVMNLIVDNSLDATSSLIKRIVETGLEEWKGEVHKDSLIARYILGDFDDFNNEQTETHIVQDVITEELITVSLPVWYIHESPAWQNYNYVDQVQNETGGEAVLYQYHEKGFIAIQSTFRDEQGNRLNNQLIPEKSFIHTLILREKPYYRREYLNGEWYLSSYSLLLDGNKILGAIYVAQKQIQIDRLKENILSIKVGEEGFPFLIDRGSRAVIHPTLEGVQLVQFQYIVDLVNNKNTRFQYFQEDTITGKKEEYIAFFKYIPELNWIIVVGSSFKDFYGDLYIVRNIMILIFGFSILLSILMSAILGNRIAKPITIITEKIKEISEGDVDFSQHLEIRSSDEVGRLAEYFNTFVGKLDNMQNLEKREIEVLLKDTQMNALQAQINPHFLYNTLETIRFMIGNDDIKAVQMVQLLADLFRISIGKGENYVTFQRELDHVELYVSIQKIRHQNMFTVEIDFPDEIRRLHSLKFIFQPIFENSITFAFEDFDHGGLIHIEARIIGDKIRIRIRDNGAGMSTDKLESIRKQFLGIQNKSSIGLHNIYERIKVHYGSSYGMEIYSSLESGTTVILWLPILKKLPSTAILPINNPDLPI